MRVSMIDPSLFTLTYDQGLASGLAAAGHDVTLYGRRPGPDDSDPGGVPLAEVFYRFAGSKPIASLPRHLRLGVKGLDHLWSMGRLLRRLRRERPDVIHFQWLPLPVMDRWMLEPFRRVAPLVLTVHDTNPFNGDPSSQVQAHGFAGCLSLFDRLIVHTERGRERMHAQGVSPERVAIFPHGTAERPSLNNDTDAMLGPLTFVLFGKIKPYKGADTLIEAFAQLPVKLRSQASVRIVGKAYMDLAPLHALAQSRGVAKQVVIEPRFVSDAEIPELFAQSTVAVFPYREIDTSGVLPQALACGRPVLASRVGVFRETLTDGVHGHLVEPGNVPAFAEALAHFIEDRPFAAACAVNASIESDQGCSWTQVAERTAALYHDVLNETGRTTSRDYGTASSPPPAFRNLATEISNSTRKITGGNC